MAAVLVLLLGVASGDAITGEVVPAFVAFGNKLLVAAVLVLLFRVASGLATIERATGAAPGSSILGRTIGEAASNDAIVEGEVGVASGVAIVAKSPR